MRCSAGRWPLVSSLSLQASRSTTSTTSIHAFQGILDTASRNGSSSDGPAVSASSSLSPFPFLAASRVPSLAPWQNRFHAPIVYHEDYSFDNWPSHYTFPMDKFKYLRQVVLTKQDHLPRPLVRDELDLFRVWDTTTGTGDTASTTTNTGTMEETSSSMTQFVDAVPRQWFEEPQGPIDANFFQRFCHGQLTLEEQRWIGFREQCNRPELIRRTILEVLGTILTCQLACQYGIASNLAGGTHHAHATMGAGYTILNDLAIATNYLTSPTLSGNGTIQKVMVLDCDVHQGDGTAKFTKLHEEGRLVTISIHCASNYPRLKAHSTMDVGVADGMKDEDYLQILHETIESAMERYTPDLVLYDAGVDVYRYDKLGRLNLSEQGIRRRDRYVLESCVQRGIPVAAVIGGGYDKDVLPWPSVMPLSMKNVPMSGGSINFGTTGNRALFRNL